MVQSKELLEDKESKIIEIKRLECERESKMIQQSKCASENVATLMEEIETLQKTNSEKGHLILRISEENDAAKKKLEQLEHKNEDLRNIKAVCETKSKLSLFEELQEADEVFEC